MQKIKSAAIVILLLNYYLADAEPGAMTRFRIEVITFQNESFFGYCYLPDTVSTKYRLTEDFFRFARENHLFPLEIYKQVKSLEVVKNLDIEFFIKGMKEMINSDSILQIKVSGIKKYPAGVDFIELTSPEYQTIQSYPFNKTVIFNDDLSVQCAFYLIGWTGEWVFYRKKWKLHTRVNRLVRKGKYDEVFLLIEEAKPDLLSKRMVIFYHCDEMTRLILPDE
jgi:hypothetical protein